MTPSGDIQEFTRVSGCEINMSQVYGRGRCGGGTRRLMSSVVAGALEKLSAPLCAHVQVKVNK